MNEVYHDKRLSIVDMMSQTSDIDKMREIIQAYGEGAKEDTNQISIHGVTFYYDGFELTDEMVEYLEGFSLCAEDEAYTVYLDDSNVVIL